MMKDLHTLLPDEEVEHGVVTTDTSEQRFRRGGAATAAGLLLAGALVLGLAMAGGGLRASPVHEASELYRVGGLDRAELLSKFPVTITLTSYHQRQFGETHGVIDLSISKGKEEQWDLVPVLKKAGKFWIKSHCGKFLSDHGGDLRLTTKGDSGDEEWTVRDGSYNTIVFTSDRGRHLSDGDGHPGTSDNMQGFEKWTVARAEKSKDACQKNPTSEALLKNLKTKPKKVTIEGKSPTRWGKMVGHNSEYTRFSELKGADQEWTLTAVGDDDLRVYIGNNDGKYLGDNNGNVFLSSRKEGWERWSLSDGPNKEVYVTSWWGKRLSNYNDHLGTTRGYDGESERWIIK